jgi:folate-binding protein YgfZ
MNHDPQHEIFRWGPAACLRVSGADAATFLQGQFTNDLQKQTPAQAVYGLWLNQKGKTLADSFVMPRGAAEFLVVSYFSPAAVIRERLEAYIIADDVVVEDLTASARGVTVFSETRPTDSQGAIIFPGRRSRESHWEILTIAGEPDGISGHELTAEEMERRRILAAIPAVPLDIGPSDLPNEGGLEGDAISYTKGCYLGQEVMARLKSMGQVRRRLVRVRGNGAMPSRPSALFQAQRKVGDLRTAAVDGGGWVGLALISLVQAQAGNFSLTENGAADITVVESP